MCARMETRPLCEPAIGSARYGCESSDFWHAHVGRASRSKLSHGAHDCNSLECVRRRGDATDTNWSLWRDGIHRCSPSKRDRNQNRPGSSDDKCFGHDDARGGHFNARRHCSRDTGMSDSGALYPIAALWYRGRRSFSYRRCGPFSARDWFTRRIHSIATRAPDRPDPGPARRLMLPVPASQLS